MYEVIQLKWKGNIYQYINKSSAPSLCWEPKGIITKDQRGNKITTLDLLTRNLRLVELILDHHYILLYTKKKKGEYGSSWSFGLGWLYPQNILNFSVSIMSTK